MRKAAPEIEVVEANLDDAESLNKAMHSAYGVFDVTYFCEHGGGATQKKIIDAGKKSQVQLLSGIHLITAMSPILKINGKLMINLTFLERHYTLLSTSN